MKNICAFQYKDDPMCARIADGRTSYYVTYNRLQSTHRCRFHDTSVPRGSFYSEDEAWADHVCSELTKEIPND